MPLRRSEYSLSEDANRNLRTSFAVRGTNYSSDSANAAIHDYARKLKANEITETGWRRGLGRLSIDAQNIPIFWINGMFDRAVAARTIALNDVGKMGSN